MQRSPLIVTGFLAFLLSLALGLAMITAPTYAEEGHSTDCHLVGGYNDGNPNCLPLPPAPPTATPTATPTPGLN